MKQSVFIPKNTPYLSAEICIALGALILSYGYLSAPPATRDPDIGVALTLLAGYFLVAVGIVCGLIALLVRRYKSFKRAK